MLIRREVEGIFCGGPKRCFPCGNRKRDSANTTKRNGGVAAVLAPTDTNRYETLESQQSLPIPMKVYKIESLQLQTSQLEKTFVPKFCQTATKADAVVISYGEEARFHGRLGGGKHGGMRIRRRVNGPSIRNQESILSFIYPIRNHT